jgi:hypothetical protein
MNCGCSFQIPVNMVEICAPSTIHNTKGLYDALANVHNYTTSKEKGFSKCWDKYSWEYWKI